MRHLLCIWKWSQSGYIIRLCSFLNRKWSTLLVASKKFHEWKWTCGWIPSMLCNYYWIDTIACDIHKMTIWTIYVCLNFNYNPKLGSQIRQVTQTFWVELLTKRFTWLSTNLVLFNITIVINHSLLRCLIQHVSHMWHNIYQLVGLGSSWKWYFILYTMNYTRYDI